jgi:hypothetical protein
MYWRELSVVDPQVAYAALATNLLLQRAHPVATPRLSDRGHLAVEEVGDRRPSRQRVVEVR